MSRRKHGHSKQKHGKLQSIPKRTGIAVFEDTPPWEWPSDAGRQFQAVLTDTNASLSDRIIAAGLSGDIVAIDDELCDVLLSVVGDAGQPAELRAKAAISLGPVLEEAYIMEFDELSEVPITEPAFHRIRQTLAKFFSDESFPKEVRRRILEASIRAPEDWHGDAIRQAYSGGDGEWVLTAVFGMRWVRGFDDQILEAMDNNDPDIQAEAVRAAGNWSLDAAWDRVRSFTGDDTPKGLRLAAIGAVATIRPQETRDVLEDLEDSGDEEIDEAVEEAIMMADVGVNPFDSSDENAEDEDADDLPF